MEGQRRTCNPIELSKLASRSDKPRCKRGGFFSFFCRIHDASFCRAF